MENYLERLCKSLAIKLVYTTNKVTVLSCSHRNNIPMLRAHKIFKKCPENLATAIVEYYTNSKVEKENLNTIQEYVKNNFLGDQFKIQPSEEMFKQLIIKNMLVKEVQEDNLEQISEYKIASIVQTDFYGNKSKIKPEETLKPSSNDILELNIIVLPPVT